MSLHKKVIVVGDGGCGKTCLRRAFAKDVFFTEDILTVCESYVADVEVADRTIKLLICDTSGQEDYDRLRSRQYPYTDVVLVCFSVVWRHSFNNVRLRWLPEVRRYCPTAPILLVGTKSDLKTDEDELKKVQKRKETVVTRKEGEALARQIGAVGYLECSAKTKVNVQQVFVAAAEATLASRENEKTKCVVM